MRLDDLSFLDDEVPVSGDKVPMHLDLDFIDLDSLAPRTAEIVRGELLVDFRGEPVAWDIETGPALDILDRIPPPPDMPDFDPASVKTGDCRTQEKKDAKIALRRQEHVDKWRAEVDGWTQKHLERAALNPFLANVLAVSYHHDGGPIIHIADDEEQLIRGVWRVVSGGSVMAGWNTHGFDLPFLVKRSWRLGITIPTGLLNAIYRRWADTQVDMMKVWTIGERGSGEYVNIGYAASLLGIGYKPPGAGGLFADIYRDPERQDEAITYLIDEACLHWNMGRRMRLI